MRYVAIYSKDLFPMEEDRIINKEFCTVEDCVKFLDEANNGLNFWNPHIYDNESKSYFSLETAKFLLEQV